MMQRKERVGFFKSLQGVCSLLRSETEKLFCDTVTNTVSFPETIASLGEIESNQMLFLK